jgi:hypothetical protein
MEKKSNLPLVGALVDRLKRRSDHEAIKAAMSSKGDVTKVEGFATLNECVTRLAAIDGGGSLGKPMRTVRRTLDALVRHKPAFTQAFGDGGSEAVRLVYASAVAGLWHAVSLLCVDGVTFVKGADGNFGQVANKSGIDALAGTILFTRLEKFADSAATYGFETTVTESAPAIEREALREAVFHELFGGVIAGIAVLIALLYIARDLTEFFYTLRGTFSRWLETQARFLEMNAASLGSVKPTARAKQEEYARRLRALADRIKVDEADAEKQASRSIQQNDRELASVPNAAPAVPSLSGGTLL